MYAIENILADTSIDIFEVAPIWLNVYMTGHIFETIITSLSFNDLPLPYFKDKFFEFLQTIVSCNQYMNDVFIPS